MTDIRECSHVHTCQCHVTWSDITPWHIVWLTVTVKQQPSSVESELCPLLHSASVLRGPRYNKDAYCSSVLNLSRWLWLKSVIRYTYVHIWMEVILIVWGKGGKDGLGDRSQQWVWGRLRAEREQAGQAGPLSAEWTGSWLTSCGCQPLRTRIRLLCEIILPPVTRIQWE